jgi:phosphoglycerate-specific signal transduction histidine kinase|tara:strand:- start:109 stop:330 length:222 start_codon:yes stop_codon:yes gene_type:complete
MKKLTKYYTNKTIKERIDKLLHKMSSIIANKDTESKLDFGKRTKFELRKIEKSIKEIDPAFYDLICPYGYLDT